MPVYPFFFYFTPGTCAEQTTLPHSYAHGFKPMKRNDKTQFILPYMRPHRRIKQAKKGAASLIPVFLHGKRYHRRTSRTEHGSHGIRRIVVIECPGTQTGKYIGSGKKTKVLRHLQNRRLPDQPARNSEISCRPLQVRAALYNPPPFRVSACNVLSAKQNREHIQASTQIRYKTYLRHNRLLLRSDSPECPDAHVAAP